MENRLFKNICARIDQYENEAIELQRAITALSALGPENGGDGECARAEFLYSYLNDKLKCDELIHYDAPDSRVSTGMRPNFTARFKGKSSERKIWLMSHLDVVPPGDLAPWDSDPWEVRVKDGLIYGRGTEDNQQGIVSSLLTAKAFRDENIQPENDLMLLMVADEETGSQYGIQYLLKQQPELFSEDDFIIIPDSGNSEGSVVEIAEKSIVWIKCKVFGKQTHGSTPELGINAHRAGASLIVALNRLYKTFSKADPIFEPPTSTFEPTRKEANVPNVNTVPGEDCFYFDCRLLPNYGTAELLKEVARICHDIELSHKVRVELSTPQLLEAPKPTPEDAPVVKAIQASLKELRDLDARAIGIGGGTVAAFFRQAGLPAIVWATQDETLHAPNEYVRIANILEDAKIFAHVALQK